MLCDYKEYQTRQEEEILMECLATLELHMKSNKTLITLKPWGCLINSP